MNQERILRAISITGNFLVSRRGIGNAPHKLEYFYTALYALNKQKAETVTIRRGGARCPSCGQAVSYKKSYCATCGQRYALADTH